MANVCPRCSTENADGVLVCRQCGTSLAPRAGWSRSLMPDDDNFDPLTAPTLIMRHTVPADLPPLQSILIPPERQRRPIASMLLLGVAALAAAVGAGLWLSRGGAPGALPAARPEPAPVAASTEPPPRVATTPELPPVEASASLPVAAAAAPAAPSTSAAAVPPQSASGIAGERRKRIPEPPSRAQATEAAPLPAPAELEVSAPATQPTAPEPVKAKTVSDQCGSAGLLTRSLCEHRECVKPENASDPVCIRIKEVEEARRFRQ